MNILMSIPERRGVNSFIRKCLIETAVKTLRYEAMPSLSKKYQTNFLFLFCFITYSKIGGRTSHTIYRLVLPTAFSRNAFLFEYIKDFVI